MSSIGFFALRSCKHSNFVPDLLDIQTQFSIKRLYRLHPSRSQTLDSTRSSLFIGASQGSLLQLLSQQVKTANIATLFDVMFCWKSIFTKTTISTLASRSQSTVLYIFEKLNAHFFDFFVFFGRGYSAKSIFEFSYFAENKPTVQQAHALDYSHRRFIGKTRFVEAISITPLKCWLLYLVSLSEQSTKCCYWMCFPVIFILSYC